MKKNEVSLTILIVQIYSNMVHEIRTRPAPKFYL